MDNRSTTPSAAVIGLLMVVAAASCVPARAQDAAKAAGGEAVPKFDAAYLADAENIKVGQAVWVKQCRHCHGSSAYPGKAPKLSPGGLEPDFIFDRVTNGFRAMPAWNGVFTLEERKAVAAYIKSTSFSP